MILEILGIIAPWLIIIICVEAVTEIIVSSDLFFNLRDWIGRNGYVDKNTTPILRHKIFNFLAKLIHCGYCTSVWVAGIFVWALPGTISELWYIDIIPKLFAIHRLSNWFHELMKRWLDRHPFNVVIYKTGDNDEQK